MARVGEYDEEFQIRRSNDGLLRFVHSRAELVLGENGTPVKVAGVIQDVTEQRLREEELFKLNRTLQAMSGSNQAMMRAGSEPEYLKAVCDVIVERCGYSMVWIGLTEEGEAKRIAPAAYAGFDEGYVSRLNITWEDAERGRGPTGTAVRTGKPAMCDVLTDPAFIPWREEALKRGYRSILALPLIHDGRVLGAITIYSPETNQFSEEEIGLLTRLSDDLAYGITTLGLREERARAQEKLRTSRLQLEEAADLSRMVYYESDPNSGDFIFNDAFYALYGTTAAREGGYRMTRGEYGRRFVHPDDGSELIRQVEKNKTCPGADGIEPFKHRVVRRDGEVIHILNRNRAVMDSEGRILRIVGVNQDITEQKRIEEALRTSQLRLWEAMDLAGIVYWELDVATEDFLFNDAFYAFYGTTAEREGGYRMSMAEYGARFIHPEDLPRFIQLKDDYPPTAGEFLLDFGHRIIRKDGQVRHILSRIRSVADGTGAFRIYGANQDITERKLAEEALRESEEKFRLLFEKSPDATMLFDGDTCMDCNEVALKHVSWLPRGQLIGSHPSKHWPERQPDGRLSSEKVKEYYETLLKEGVVHFEWVSRDPGRSRILG